MKMDCKREKCPKSDIDTKSVYLFQKWPLSRQNWLLNDNGILFLLFFLWKVLGGEVEK